MKEVEVAKEAHAKVDILREIARNQKKGTCPEISPKSNVTIVKSMAILLMNIERRRKRSNQI